MNYRGCFIHGRWVETPNKLPVLSPWSGEVVGEVCLAGAAEWEAAISAAQEAAAVMRKFSSLERRQLLEKLVAGVKARQEELAQTIVAEGGKPITYARGEMARGVMTLALAAEEAARIGGEVLPLDLTRAAPGPLGDHPALSPGAGPGDHALQLPLQPGGPQGGSGPGRGQPHHHQAASKTPLTALKLAEIYDQAGPAPRRACRCCPVPAAWRSGPWPMTALRPCLSPAAPRWAGT